MYAVIFTAVLNTLDQDYTETAARMRQLAMTRYGCLDFTSVSEDGVEISVSYWPDQDQLSRWRRDPEHRRAQQLGRSRWYKSYRVQVVEVVREYSGGG